MSSNSGPIITAARLPASGSCSWCVMSTSMVGIASRRTEGREKRYFSIGDGFSFAKAACDHGKNGGELRGIQRSEGNGMSSQRRSHVVGAVLLASAAAGVLAGGLSAPASAATQPRPNVIVVETDDQAAETIRAMPNVQSEIMNQGTTFSNSFVNFSQCCPSRATFLTGQYAHNHHVLSNHPPSGGWQRFALLHGHNNLAIWLREAGYRTALVGKFLNHFGANGKVRPPHGWSRWVSAIGREGGAQRVYNYDLDIDGHLVHYGHEVKDFKQDVLTRNAVKFVRDAAPQARPFFLWLTYTAPHNAGPNPNPRAPSDCQGSPKPAPRHAHVF